MGGAGVPSPEKDFVLLLGKERLKYVEKMRLRLGADHFHREAVQLPDGHGAVSQKVLAHDGFIDRIPYKRQREPVEGSGRYFF